MTKVKTTFNKRDNLIEIEFDFSNVFKHSFSIEAIKIECLKTIENKICQFVTNNEIQGISVNHSIYYKSINIVINLNDVNFDKFANNHYLNNENSVVWRCFIGIISKEVKNTLETFLEIDKNEVFKLEKFHRLTKEILDKEFPSEKETKETND